MIIEDGYGSSLKARVDDSNRLWTFATVPIAFSSLNYGLAYDFSTGGYISITSVDTETGIFYLKNDEPVKNLFVHSLRTCADAVHKVQLYKNPTGGTLISGAVLASGMNLNFTSSNTPTATYYKGAEGATISGGSVLTQHINNVGHSVGVFDDALILGPGDSIGLSFQLASAGDCCVRIVSYFE